MTHDNLDTSTEDIGENNDHYITKEDGKKAESTSNDDKNTEKIMILVQIYMIIVLKMMAYLPRKYQKCHICHPRKRTS